MIISQVWFLRVYDKDKNKRLKSYYLTLVKENDFSW